MLQLKLYLLVSVFSACCWCGCVEKKRLDDVCCPVLDNCFTGFYSLLPNPNCPSGVNEVFYDLWTRKHDQRPTTFSMDKIPMNDFRKKGKIYLIVPGWNNEVNQTEFQEMKNELLKKEDVNILIVNYQVLANHYLYLTSVSNTRSAAAHVAKVLKKIKAKKMVTYTWCLGFSLGAHVCAQVGKGTHLNRITGLDPAGPFFHLEIYRELTLNAKSADFVDVIHTSDVAGLHKPLGDVDFYVDGGKTHPACSKISIACNHYLALILMTSSIMNNCFRAQKCKAYNDIKSSCKNGTVFTRMGYNANPKKHGLFFLKSRMTYPFCF